MPIPTDEGHPSPSGKVTFETGGGKDSIDQAPNQKIAAGGVRKWGTNWPQGEVQGGQLLKGRPPSIRRDRGSGNNKAPS